MIHATLPIQAPIPAIVNDHNRLRLFSGSANVPLSTEVARYLGLDLGPMVRKHFADGELYIQIQESIRGCDVYLIQPSCYPVNDNLMELLIMIDACHRASARQITAVIPYYGYARAFAKKLNDAPLAIIDKRRQAHNVAEVFNVIGDVKDKTAVLVDDMIDTAGTICEGGRLLREKGARQVYACATHAVFSGTAIERLSNGIFEEVIVTNTIPFNQENSFPQLIVLSAANLLGETIWRIHEDTSVSSMFR